MILVTKKIFISFLIILLSMQFLLPFDCAYAGVSPQIADFLCEKGISYFDIGKYPEALVEFKKALLADPDSVVAKEFIDILVKKVISVNSFLDRAEKTTVSKPAEMVPSEVNEFQQAVIAQKSSLKASAKPIAPSVSATVSGSGSETVVDVGLKQAGKDYVDVEASIGDRVIMRGNNITRFIVTEPPYLNVTRQDENNLLVEPQEAGSTYLHIWQGNERKSFKYQIGPRRFVEQLLKDAQEKLRQENLPESFKLSYSMDGDSFMTGRGVGDLKRQSLTYGYSSSLIGQTPFGNVDAAIGGSRTTTGNYRVSNVRAGLTNGHYDQFKDFTIRALDFTPGFPSYGFPSSDLRGILLSAPMFNKTLSYTSFWGAIPGGNFTQLAQTSGLSPTKKAWLEGIGVNYKAGRSVNLKSFYAHSYGSERSLPVLTSDVSGFGMDYHLGHFNLDAQMAYDHLESISYSATTSIQLPKLRVGFTTTDSDKKFANLLGGNPGGGSMSQALNINYRPVSNVTVSNSFSATLDKVFGNPNEPGRRNYNSNTRINWELDPHSELQLGYTFDDQMGSVSPAVVETKEVTFRKKIFLFRKLSTFLSYQNSKSKNYSSPAQDFNNNRIIAGISARLLYDIYGYYRKEMNLIRNKFSNEEVFPTAQEIGINYNRQIFKTPFYTNLRLSYRDEEDTDSVLSFMSGEDRLEGLAELTFKPTPDNEAFIRARISDIWAEKAGAAKHFDFDLSWGIRLLWDTAFRWRSVGGFCGYVFYDQSGDGARQSYERGVKGAIVKASDGKTCVTNAAGFYKIPHIAGKETTISLDLSTIPKGYSPTTSAAREVDIVHAKTKRIDFGITTRSEISGLIFNDKNNNGTYDSGEQGVAGVAIVLDDKSRAISSPLGEYMLRKLTPGDHILKLDLKTLPVKFIPKVSIIKTVKVLEGATFVYNIPLQEAT
jgi:tetratricopeptide (TPR) repeat protein